MRWIVQGRANWSKQKRYREISNHCRESPALFSCFAWTWACIMLRLGSRVKWKYVKHDIQIKEVCRDYMLAWVVSTKVDKKCPARTPNAIWFVNTWLTNSWINSVIQSSINYLLQMKVQVIDSLTIKAGLCMGNRNTHETHASKHAGNRIPSVETRCSGSIRPRRTCTQVTPTRNSVTNYEFTCSTSLATFFVHEAPEAN